MEPDATPFRPTSPADDTVPVTVLAVGDDEVSGVRTAVDNETLVDLTAHSAPLLRVVPAVVQPATADEATTMHRAIGPLALAALIIWCASIGQLLMLGVVAALAFMILFHEAGHFVAARLTGMKATEFFLGFGPRVWSFRRGGTEFGVKALPLGGYVKVIGMTNLEELADPADEPRTYRAASFPRKVLLASAGTMAHFLLAFVLLLSLNSGFGRVSGFTRPIVGSVDALAIGSSPAAVAGIRSGDRIIDISGTSIEIGSDVRAAIDNATTLPLSVTVDRQGIRKTVPLIPVRDVDGVMRIGVQWDENGFGTTTNRVGLVEGAGDSLSSMVRLIPETWGGLFRFFAPSSLKSYGSTLGKAATNKALTQAESQGRMSSAVGISRMMRDASRDDVRTAIELFAIVNVFVGMFNMLPLMPLDGGHVLVATYERLRSRRGRMYHVDFRKLLPVTYVVLLVMSVIGFTSLYLDITKPLSLF